MSIWLLAALAACDSKDDASQDTQDSGLSEAELADLEIDVVRYDCTISGEDLMGEPHRYEETIDGDVRLIELNGVPNHDVAEFPITTADYPANEVPAIAQDQSYSIPVTPSGEGRDNNSVFGVTLSGAIIHYAGGAVYQAEDGTVWTYELLRGDVAGLDLGLDCNNAHPFAADRNYGAYHYHSVPESMMSGAEEMTHIGWAGDGYPIFARFGYADPADPSQGVSVMRGSYRLKAGEREGDPFGDYDGSFIEDYEYVDGAGDLDACNGRVGDVEVDGRTYDYAYFMTDTFPFGPPCWVAEPGDDFDGGPP